MNPRMSSSLDRAKGMLGGFTAGQRAVVAVAVIALVLGAVALTRWVSQPTMTPLFGNLAGEDANAIVEQLTADGVKYELTNGGSTILVPQQQVYDLRVSLSGAGLPANEGEDGYSLLDEQGITATDFQQNVAYRRALEGELSKTLNAMDGVKTAVVRLAIPEKDVFTTEQDKTTSSVLLALKPGVELEREQVQSITHLVAGSVEGLDPADVTVSDSTGKMYSSNETGTGAAASESDEQTATYESRVSTGVQRMLDTVVGKGRSAVTVSARLNFDATDSTTERYVAQPNVPPRSESTTREGYTGGAAGNGGPLGQTFPDVVSGNGTGAGAGTYAKEESTVNNSVGKVVERVQSAPGAVERMTVAVVLDAKTAGAVDTAQVQQLVAGAVGLDPQRGDSVQVSVLPFDTTTADAAAKELAEAEKAETTAGYIDMAKQGGLWLLGLLVLFILFRRRRKRGGLEATASDLPSDGRLITPTAIALDGGPMTALTADDPRLGRDKVRQEVAALVDSQPDDVALMLQGWLDERKV